MAITDLHQLFLHELRNLYSAESLIIKALPKMIAEASHEELKLALDEHLIITKAQLERLDTIAEDFNFKTREHECVGMKGILSEAEETLKEITDPATKDAAIIASAQKVEHYEIAGYGSVSQYARDMEHDEAADILEETLDEEIEADDNLTELAEGGLFSSGINKEAIED